MSVTENDVYISSKHETCGRRTARIQIDALGVGSRHVVRAPEFRNEYRLLFEFWGTNRKSRITALCFVDVLSDVSWPYAVKSQRSSVADSMSMYENSITYTILSKLNVPSALKYASVRVRCAPLEGRHTQLAYVNI